MQRSIGARRRRLQSVESLLKLIATTLDEGLEPLLGSRRLILEDSLQLHDAFVDLVGSKVDGGLDSIDGGLDGCGFGSDASLKHHQRVVHLIRLPHQRRVKILEGGVEVPELVVDFVAEGPSSVDDVFRQQHPRIVDELAGFRGF